MRRNPSPRGGLEPSAVWRLDQRRYWDKRERERERDVSALLTHLPTGGFTPARIPGTYVPDEPTRKQLPLEAIQVPLQKKPSISAARSTTKEDPNPIYVCTGTRTDAMTGAL